MRRARTAGLLIAAAVTAASCGSATVDARPLDELFTILDRQLEAAPPASDLLQLVPLAPCALVDRFTCDGGTLELVGSATARLGEVGSRYQCAFHGETANARFEIIRLDDDDAYADHVDLLGQRSGNETKPLAGHTVHVVRYEAGATRYVDAELVVPDRQGAIHLVLEPTGQRWNNSTTADVIRRLDDLII